MKDIIFGVKSSLLPPAGIEPGLLQIATYGSKNRLEQSTKRPFPHIYVKSILLPPAGIEPGLLQIAPVG
jgi:hypothetical protein